LLTYRTHMTCEDLWKLLLARFNNNFEGAADAEATQKKARTRYSHFLPQFFFLKNKTSCPFANRIVGVVRKWILNHHIDYETDITNVSQLVQFLDLLASVKLDHERDQLLIAMESRG